MEEQKSAFDLGLYVSTPIIERKYKVDDNGNYIKVYFKLENVQPSGSFKDRGIGHMIATLIEQNEVSVLITSSGGNAGLSVATIGQKLGIPVKVFVPVTTQPIMIEKIKATGAQVFINGENWNAADAFAREAVTLHRSAQYIPPFDDPRIWDGHSSIVDELKEYFKDDYPNDIVLSVGGGGLLAGIQRGMERVGWHQSVIKAVETTGAASFAAAKIAGKVVKLDKISTIATTLGALAVTSATLETSIQTQSIVVSDDEAVTATYYFGNDHRILVEPSCGAALSLACLKDLREKYLIPNCMDCETKETSIRKIVVIVCGGSAVNLELLSQWKDTYVNRYESKV